MSLVGIGNGLSLRKLHFVGEKFSSYCVGKDFISYFFIDSTLEKSKVYNCCREFLPGNFLNGNPKDNWIGDLNNVLYSLNFVTSFAFCFVRHNI